MPAIAHDLDKTTTTRFNLKYATDSEYYTFVIGRDGATT